MARREGLHLEQLSGSGPHGRIVKADVLAALAELGTGCASSHAEAQSGPAFDAIPNSIGRKLIARRLTESKQQAPHFYLRMDCDVGAVQQWRASRAEVDGVKLSLNAFIIKAAALALKDVPGVNASYTDAAIRRYHQVNISVAVALDDGLVTPVIEDADRKTLAQIARAVKDFSARARAGKLEPGESRDRKSVV